MIGVQCSPASKYISGYYAQCAFVSVPGRNNMSGYDQGSHLASLAQTQLLATPACAVASSANGQPSCVHKVCPRWEDDFSNVHYPILKF